MLAFYWLFFFCSCCCSYERRTESIQRREVGRGEEVEWLLSRKEYINRMQCRSVKYIITSVLKYRGTVLVFEGVH